MYEYKIHHLQFASMYVVLDDMEETSSCLNIWDHSCSHFPAIVCFFVLLTFFCLSPQQSALFTIMASGALFPSMVSGSRGSSSKYLVEFRAGKMTMKGSTVTPDKRKGQVYIQQTDDSLIHFCWKDRTTGNVDDVG